MTEQHEQAMATVDWQRFLAERTQSMKSSAIRELLKITQLPDVISFAGGLPAPSFFPYARSRRRAAIFSGTRQRRPCSTAQPRDIRRCASSLAESMADYGIHHGPDNVLITTGSQQALDLIGKVFIDPGASVLTCRPTYLGAIQAWRAYQAHFVTVPLDDDGMQVEVLEEIVSRVPVRFIYVLPNFHNPAGTTLTEPRRRRLVEIARNHDLLIIEDDPYGALRYEGEDLTPIAALAPERTIYLGTFSKTLSPGLRIGWIVAPTDIRQKLVQAKQGTDLHTSTFDQMIANDIAQRGILRVHVRQLRQAYRERRDTMLDAMAEFWPEGSSWTHPQGGLFLWARAPEGVDSLDMLKIALEHRIAYVPGVNFYPDEDGGENAMRLNFSTAKPEMIVEGIHRLGKTIADALRRA